jgi:hypothetical protein
VKLMPPPHDARFYAEGKAKATWTLRIVFLLWLLASMVLILTVIAHAWTQARPPGHEKTKASGEPRLRIDSINLPLPWHAGCKVASPEGFRRTQRSFIAHRMVSGRLVVHLSQVDLRDAIGQKGCPG